MSKRLAKIAEAARAYNFTEAQIRWWVFQAESNGLATSGAVLRIGRSIRIDLDRFDTWLESKAQPRTVAA